MTQRAKRDRFSWKGDRLSALPDSILTHHILARLPIEEAAKTKILCRKWRHLRTPVIEFFPKLDMFKKVENIKMKCQQRRVALTVAKEYADRVNRAINNMSDGEGSLVRFCIHFPSSVIDYMESWLKFSLGDKGVEELELRSFIGPYGVSTLGSSKAQIQPSLFPKLRMLKSLTLCWVPMTSENLEHLLVKCVFLEKLHLEGLLSRHCQVRITGPVSRLKYVNIDDIRCPMSIIVSAPTPDLISLRYPAHVDISPIKFAPQLIDLSMGGSYEHTGFDLPSHQLFSYVSQLQSLHLGLYRWRRVEHWLPRVPDLSGLKQLTLTIYDLPKRFIVRDMISLINAASCLQHLTLEDGRGFWFFSPDSEECANLHVQSLRVIEFSRFQGTKERRPLVEYMVKGVTSLHKLIIDSRNADKHFCAPRSEIETWGRCVLKSILPSEAKLILLHKSEYDDMVR